ncbi:MAG: NACHT domain-containing protein [Planctomycetaceae bacterium]|nr:NACHT domain-containing protein [Planctomycetaceae bacterium]
MAEFGNAELRHLKRIPKGDQLHTSLRLLREAVEKIWDAEAPRIIQGFTDHGIRHYERLAQYSLEILNANQGKALNKHETYLLLAGIYIHDIGMQCDIVRFPAIKYRAIELGAKFEKAEFTADNANSYPLDEQRDIRKTHHYLSIAWLDVARKDPSNILHTAALSIPVDLVPDLKDICKHHTKLPITGCPVTFMLDSRSRKLFVAAILRFADELDVQNNRVNIETVKMFALSPENSVFWWLHHLTRINFPTPSLLNVSLTLHPDDYNEFSKTVHDIYINEFRTKNLPVLSVLAQNCVPIVMDAESKVIRFDETEKLPEEVKAILRGMATPQKSRELIDPLLNLANEIRLWLRAIRYEVGEAPEIIGDVAEMVATLETGTIKQSILVRCVARAIAVDDVRLLDKALTRKVNQGWLISDRTISTDVRRVLGATDVLAFRLSEFLELRVWGPYIDALTALVHKARIPELYVDLGCYRQPSSRNDEIAKRESYQSLNDAIDEWLLARDKMHVSILGEFGSGKTWFCRNYAYRQLLRYLKNPATERFPLLITLRNFTKASTAKELITNAIVDQYQLSFVGDPFDIFNELNRRGKILLILDGFDEMARKVDKQTMVDNFWELAKLVEDNSKVVLTSRTEYFRWAKEAETVLGGEELGRRIPALQPPKFDVLYLEPFTDEQIRSVIKGRLRDNGDAVAARLLQDSNLRAMARKPVLVELLLAAVEEVKADLLTDQAAVYLYATNKLLLRNITEHRTFTTTADKLLFLCELAWQMIQSGELRIHYQDIPGRIRQHFAEKIKGANDLDHWDYDLRNQTLLRPDLQGYYEFSHKSIAEYFVAFKFISELGLLAPPFSITYVEEGEARCDLPFQVLHGI